MTLTAMTTDNYLTNDIIITFPTDAIFEAAISAVKVDGIAVSYSTTDSSITIDADSFKMVATYTITVEATGYSDSTVSQVVEVADWDNITLFDYSDVVNLEDVLLDFIDSSEKAKHPRVKNEMRDHLLRRLKFYQTRGQASDKTYFLLDHIENPYELREAAIYRSIVIICSEESIADEDQYYKKMKYYNKKYWDSLKTALSKLSFDTDFLEYQSRRVYFSG